MRLTSPMPGGKRSAHAAWCCLCVMVLAVVGTSLAQRPALADDAPPADLEGWARQYPFQYSQWKESAHGKAYLQGDENAPGCTDCHEDPATGQVYTPAYRLGIPSRCGACHADPEKMKGSGLATDVYETYLADTHGRTIEYYHQTDPEARRYEAVCSDCHGSHSAYIVPAADLTETCQSCHGTATARFSTASMGHFRAGRLPLLVTVVRIFYFILIPVVMGVMLGYIALDIWRRARCKRQGRTA